MSADFLTACRLNVGPTTVRAGFVKSLYSYSPIRDNNPMKLVRIVAALVAFVFVLGALPEFSLASPARHSASSHHVQARRGHRHKKRARRHKRKGRHAKSSGSGSSGSNSGGGMEF